MNIWITEIGEPLPIEKNVRMHRYGEFSRYLASKGHKVTLWTSTFSHAPKQHFLEKNETHVNHGVRIQYIHGPGYKKNVSFARILHEKKFAKDFYELAKKETEKPDIIISPIPTINIAEKAVKLAKELNVPIVTDVRDLWPDVIVELLPKPLRPFGKLALRSAYKKMKFVCNNVYGIMGTCQQNLNYGLSFVERGQNERDFFFPHGYTVKEIAEEDLKKAKEWSDALHIDDSTFNICFFGTIGQYFKLEVVIAAAKILKEKNIKVKFILAGSGSKLDHFKELAKGLDNVIFPGWIDSPKIQTVMKLSKAGIAPYDPDEIFALPNKPFEYMSAGLAILSSVPYELPDLLKEYECGLSYDGKTGESLVRIVEEVYNNPGLCQKMGENAYSLFKERFSTEIVFKNTEEYLKGVIAKEAR